MRTRWMLSIVLVMVLLASAVPLAVTPAAAYEKKIPFAGEDNELTKEELLNALLPYMLEEGAYTLDDVGDAAYVYAYWDGKPKDITDQVDRTVTFYRPVERVISTSRDSTRVLIGLDACDKIVGVQESPCPSHMPEVAKACGGRLFDRPVVNRKSNPELIVSLNPDVVFGSSYTADVMQEKIGIPVVCFKFGFTLEQINDGIEFIGKVLEKENESEEIISSIEERFDKVREVTSEINESDKPTVYFAMRSYAMGGVVRTTNRYDPIDMAGAINVAKDCAGAGSITVTKEQIIKWDPDIFIIADLGTKYKKVPPADTIYTDPDFQTLRAVKNGKVYPALYPYASGIPIDRNLANTFYLAKLFHPDKFEDLDVEEEGNEIFKLFYRDDGLFSEYADFTSWMREWLDSQK